MAQKSTDEIWERLGGIAADVKNLVAKHEETNDKIDRFEVAQADHRRRVYDRMDVHDDRIAGLEAAHRELMPKVQRVYDFVDDAEVAAAKADGKRELIGQTVSVGGKVWGVVKPAIVAGALAAAAFWREVVEAFSGKPPHPWC